MRKVVFAVLCLVVLVSFAGCSTMKAKPCQALENRVSTLENKVQVLETDLKSSASPVAIAPGSEATAARLESSVSAEKMTRKEIQLALKNAGYYDGPVDGKFGKKSKAALKEFQKNMGLKADGIAGKNTKEKLLKYLQ